MLLFYFPVFPANILRNDLKTAWSNKPLFFSTVYDQGARPDRTNQFCCLFFNKLQFILRAGLAWLSCKLIGRFILWKLLPLPTYGHNYHELGLSRAQDTMLGIVNTEQQSRGGIYNWKIGVGGGGGGYLSYSTHRPPTSHLPGLGDFVSR